MKELNKDIPFSVPRSGEMAEQYAFVDDAMFSFMERFQTSAGSIAITKGGSIIAARGYGWSDKEHKAPLESSAWMRLASLTKPITATATKNLIHEGKFTLYTKALPYLGIDQPKNAAIKDITIQQLLEHRGGWDMEESGFDSVFEQERIVKELHLSHSATPSDAITFMLDKPLQFRPGERKAYGNIGYCILGRVVEKASGKSYKQYIEEEVLAPLGLMDMRFGKTKEADHLPDEVWYEQTEGSPYTPYTSFDLELLDSVGGLVGSVHAYTQFMNSYLLSGDKRSAKQEVPYAVAFGSLPGTKTMAIQRPEGFNLVTLFNRRFNPQSDILESMMNETLDRMIAME